MTGLNALDVKRRSIQSKMRTRERAKRQDWLDVGVGYAIRRVWWPSSVWVCARLGDAVRKTVSEVEKRREVEFARWGGAAEFSRA